MDSSAIQLKQQELELLKQHLKSQFFGLDEVIDQVVTSMASWYIFPENQKRPLIINLWGMTGVGKSDLVRQIVKYLQFEAQFFQFDLGELGHGPMGNPRAILSETYQFKGPEPRVILLDEFQLGRTITRMGEEIPHKELRVIWQLLDNGKIDHIEQMIAGRRNLNSVLYKFDYWVSQGMTIHQGMVASNYFGYFEEDDDESDEVEETTENEARFIFDKRRLKAILEINKSRFENIHELRKHVKTLNTLEIRKLLMDSLANTLKPSEQDFSQTLIFVVGNLDEAYPFAKDQSPDISPDKFYKLTKEIKLPDIKSALSKRFRPEQISRLGNNHIIYPSLNEYAYRAIIASELLNISTNYFAKTQAKLLFGPEIIEWIFQEGVVPTQGVRPLKSTIKYGIEDLIPMILLEHFKLECAITKVEANYRNGLSICFKQGEELRFEKTFPLTQKVRHLKESRKDDLQAVVAVHESGHAIVHMSLFSNLPDKISSVAAGSDKAGFITHDLEIIRNPTNLLQSIAVFLSGFLAEKELFGFDMVSIGSSGDFERATELAMEHFKESGFSGQLIRITPTADHFENHYHNIEPIEEKVMKFMRGAQDLAAKILKRERALLVEMSKYLADHATMEQEILSQLVQEFGTYELEAELKTKKSGYRHLLFAVNELADVYQ
ncbi:AAA family ATPase [Algoriphagus sp.]|uniref:AAA family ATPase n=1 Tax=Algoriphagus sp. TaxID=1872435 RepID=UPI00391AC753